MNIGGSMNHPIAKRIDKDIGKNTTDALNNNVLTPAKLFKVIYAIASYIISMLSLIYFIFYMNDIVISHTANNSISTLGAPLTILNNLCLLLLFGIQHSVMARPKFKRWLAQQLDPAIERATYCLSTGIVLTTICLFWSPLQGQVWIVETNWIAYLLMSFAAFGWLIMVLATFNIDHFELFGLRQVYCRLLDKPMPVMTFKVGGLYKWVRHPIQTGLLIGMWSVPQSNMGHFTLACGFTVYVFVGLYFEEKDLIKEFGQTYRNYIKRVGKLTPKILRNRNQYH